MQKNIRISSTFGPVESGILPYLAEKFAQETGIQIIIEKAGTGKTLENAKTGHFDLVMVHAKALEDEFLAQGFGLDRREIMYNDYLLLGPCDDAAHAKGLPVLEAMRNIAVKKANFVSRGDNSGNHVKERGLWEKAGVENFGSWYEAWERGDTGNRATLKHADEKKAYVLMDRATWLTMKSEISLVPVSEGGEFLINTIALIRVNPEKFVDIHADEALLFADWLKKSDVQTCIADFGKDQYGQPLFFVCREKNHF